MLRIILALAAACLLAACGGNSGGSPPASDAADVVERYITAKANGDGETLRPLLCSAMESQYEGEVMSFSAVTGVAVEGMECTLNAQPNAAGETTVTCTGEIVATYGSEDTVFPLATYRVVEEDGLWRWCGATAP